MVAGRRSLHRQGYHPVFTSLWPAMLHAAGLTPPKQVFGHGFVYKKNEETVSSNG